MSRRRLRQAAADFTRDLFDIITLLTMAEAGNSGSVRNLFAEKNSLSGASPKPGQGAPRVGVCRKISLFFL
jgi:hypothetical protein